VLKTGKGQIDGGSIDKYQENKGKKCKHPMSLPPADRCCSCPVVVDIRLHVGAAEGNICMTQLTFTIGAFVARLGKTEVRWIRVIRWR
jgi:hypothetical protein